MEDITPGGDFVLVVEHNGAYVALGTTISKKIDPVEVNVSGNTVTGSTLPVWTIAPSGAGISLFNGTEYLGYNSSTNFKASAEAEAWTVSAQDGNTFRFVHGSSGRAIAFQELSSGDKFGAYSTKNAGQAAYEFDFLVFKSTSSSGGGTGPVDPSTPPAEDPDVVPIKTALEASSGEFTVKGVVTLIDGSNVYIQDETGGICVRVSGTPDVKLGDTVIGKGTRGEYYGLPQLNSGTCTKQDSGLPPLTAKKYSVFSDLQKEDICTYVSFEGLEVTIVDDNNGSFSNPNITVKDSSGATLQIYKAVIDKVDGKWSVAVGDKLNLSAAVGCYYEKFQLRNTLSTEIQVVSKEQEPDPEPPTTGTTWTKANLEDIQPEDQIAITMTTSDGATYLLPTVGNGKKGQPLVVKGEVSGTTLTTADNADLAWNITTAEGGYYISSGGSYLSLTNENNGVRIKDIQTVWTVDGAYLTAKDTAGNTRYLGVYSSSAPTDWRAYKDKSGSGNIEGQTVGFWKLTAGGGEPTPSEGLADGTYVIWNPANNKALSSEYSKNYNKGVDVTMSGDTLTGYTDAEIWTVKKQANGYYTISINGQNLSMGEEYTSMPLGGVNDQWEIQPQADGSYYIHNVGRDAFVEWYAGNNYWSCYYNIGSGSEDLFKQKFYPATPGGTTPEPEEPKDYYKPADGDEVVIFYAGDGVVLTGTANGTRLKGADATASGGKLFVEDLSAPLVLTVHVANDVYTFTTKDGKLLNTSTNGGNLKLVDSSAKEAAEWNLRAIDGGWAIVSTTAVSKGKNQAIEYYSGNFTTYGITEDENSAFAMQFYKATDLLTAYQTDPNVVEDIAQWGGGGPYDETAHGAFIQGDLYNVGDMMDANAKFTVRAGGKDAQPFQKTNTNTGGNNYYMGGEKIGAAEGDYMQFAVSTTGWGNMTLTFRIRVTGAGAKDYTIQYSTDGGGSFSKFESGKYTFAYHNYTTNENVSGEGTISGGVLTIPKDSQYYTVTMPVPVGAENAENLLIRLVPGSEKINGKGGAIDGNVRLDSVKLSGHPITDEDFVGFVSADPNGQEEDIPGGTELTLTTATAGATIHYRFVDPKTGEGVWAVYDETAKVKLPTTLPTVLETYAEKDGKQSVTLRYAYAAGTVAAVKMTPNGGGVNPGTDGVQVKLSCETAGATIYYNMTGEMDDTGNYVWTEYTDETEILLEKGFQKVTIVACAKKEGLTDSPVTTRTFTERTQDRYNIYFGQMHSHTGYSDGTETPAAAYQYASDLDQETYNMDFLFVTDHSNSLDGAGSSLTINDVPKSNEWVQGKEAAQNSTTETFVGAFGYEMTWSNGLGHINTFNSIGFQDRTQSAYTTYSTALQNYYSMLKTAGDSISQFNHPGTTFGDFSDFAYYDEEIDQLITLIEVGNGEGAVGSSGYFPSYEYYTRALDKGWHVAPTNNQDNHKGLWGSANTARSVVLADELTEQAIYDAMRNYRVYATEDLNLEIYYTLDGNIMGSQLTTGDVGDTVKIQVELKDPNGEGGKLEVIVNGGLSLAEETYQGDGTITLEVPSSYNYYYIKITQDDGNIAVTAPVWIGAVEAVGVTKLAAQDSLTIAGKEQTFDLELYNNERKALEVTSIEYTIKETGVKIGESTDITTVPRMGVAATTFSYTFETDGIYTITATVKGILNGVEKTYTQDLEVTVMPGELVSTIIVDGTHYNDYVTGYYGGNMGNMTAIASNNAVQVKIVTDEITEETLKNCSLLVISAPAKKSGTANAGDYSESLYDQEFLDIVKNYVANGGTVIVTGLADYQDKGAEAQYHTSVQQNKLLSYIGSTMTINDDEACDDAKNGGQNYRLYPAIFNMDDPVAAPWVQGIVDGQTYSQYSGCTIGLGKGTWLVKGFDTTYSIDSDGDGMGGFGVGENTAYFLAYEQVGAGKVFAAGGVFLSDFEVKAELDNIWDLPYANRTIYENILHSIFNEENVTPISKAREAELNKIFVIEGYVTSGTTLPATTFFDAIYVQDDTGGITCFPYATTGLAIGTKVRILGYADAYQGDREIQIISLTVLDAEPNVYPPKALTTKQATDYATYGGLLVKTTGTVSQIVKSGDKISQFKLTDGTGVAATVFVDGYIWGADGTDPISADLQEGQTVEAWGLLYLHPEGEVEVNVPVLRVRNMDEIFLIKNAEEDAGSDVTMSGGSYDATKDADASVSVENVMVGEVTGVFVDGVLVDPAYYAIKDENGKTVITFTGEFLATLSGGSHTVTVAYEKNRHFQVSATLTVVGASRPIPELPNPGTASPSTPTTSTTPATPGATGDGPAKTGDAFSLGLVLGLLLLAGTGMTVTAVSLRRKKK